MPKSDGKKLKEAFKGKEYLSREELFDFFRVMEPDLNEGTFGWRIHDLKSKNVLTPVKKGLYAFAQKTDYNPVLSREALQLARHMAMRFEGGRHCIWETAWLNEFSVHQASKKMIILEIGKEWVESLFFDLKDNFHFDFFINPGEKEIDYYIAESSQPVIVKRLITRSPLAERKEKKLSLFTPLLEKILVDLFSEEKLFYLYQGPELAHICEHAIRNYTLNFTRLFGYAARREKEQEIKAFLKENLAHLVNEVMDD